MKDHSGKKTTLDIQAAAAEDAVSMEAVDARMAELMEQHRAQKEASAVQARIDAQKARSRALMRPTYRNFVGPRADKFIFTGLGLAAFLINDYERPEDKRLHALVGRWWTSNGRNSWLGRLVGANSS